MINPCKTNVFLITNYPLINLYIYIYIYIIDGVYFTHTIAHKVHTLTFFCIEFVMTCELCVHYSLR